MLALGLVETIGLVGAIEAADAMLKAADVILLEKNYADAGYVTISVAGEVSAVKASVEAARERVKMIKGQVIASVHVIPRPDLQLRTLLALDPDDLKPADPVPPAPAPAPSSEKDAGQEGAQAGDDSAQAAPAGEKPAALSEEALSAMPLAELRELARSLNIQGMSSAGKKALIAAVMKASEAREE